MRSSIGATTRLQGSVPAPGREVQVQAQRVDTRGALAARAGAQVVVQVKEADGVEHRRQQPGDVDAA